MPQDPAPASGRLEAGTSTYLLTPSFKHPRSLDAYPTATEHIQLPSALDPSGSLVLVAANSDVASSSARDLIPEAVPSYPTPRLLSPVVVIAGLGFEDVLAEQRGHGTAAEARDFHAVGCCSAKSTTGCTGCASAS